MLMLHHAIFPSILRSFQDVLGVLALHACCFACIRISPIGVFPMSTQARHQGYITLMTALGTARCINANRVAVGSAVQRT
jgi:hypothetical protein